MVIGAPKEIKDHETRISITPAGVHALREAGHEVLIERSGGEGSSMPDDEYTENGAVIVDSAADVWNQAEIVVKVKEPQPSETQFFRPGLTLFTYLHLAPLPELTQALAEKQVAAIAYETIQRPDGSLPLLEPMSEVAGRLAAQVGAEYLEKTHLGRGVLMGGVPGVAPAEVVVVGAGIVGSNAAKIAMGTGAHVTVLDINVDRLRRIDDLYNGRIATLASNPKNVIDAASKADLLIGAVLAPGKAAPKVIKHSTIEAMPKAAVFVDVAIDQGGCSETSRPTSHSEPVFIEHDVVHYCVPNMPALVPRTSTLALTNVTLPYLLKLADLGPEKAMQQDETLLHGLNTYRGEITCPGVAESQGKDWRPVRLD